MNHWATSSVYCRDFRHNSADTGLSGEVETTYSSYLSSFSEVNFIFMLVSLFAARAAPFLPHGASCLFKPSDHPDHQQILIFRSERMRISSPSTSKALFVSIINKDLKQKIFQIFFPSPQTVDWKHFQLDLEKGNTVKRKMPLWKWRIDFRTLIV